ncbi:MAG: ribonuclease III [Deltaproteobacteria bacterium]
MLTGVDCTGRDFVPRPSTMSSKLSELFGLGPESPHFDEALSHPSYANEQGLARHNQRLEFLGDAVLGLCVSELLFQHYPSADEGVLTGIRAQLVNTDSLADWAREQQISDALRLGRGAEVSNLRASNNVLADFVEALIGAVYLDLGPDHARAVCAGFVEPRLEILASERTRLDPKTELQQRVQALGGTAPTYTVIDSGGPAHDRWFVVRARLGDRWGAEGRGRSKRLAEREAARLTLIERGELAVEAAPPASEPSESSEPAGAEP